MTTLMLDELSLEQRWALNERPTDKKPNPWSPERQPSQPALRPWWQRHTRSDDPPSGSGDPLWGQGSGGS